MADGYIPGDALGPTTPPPHAPSAPPLGMTGSHSQTVGEQDGDKQRSTREHDEGEQKRAASHRREAHTE
jgi:hypothetical protein